VRTGVKCARGTGRTYFARIAWRVVLWQWGETRTATTIGQKEEADGSEEAVE